MTTAARTPNASASPIDALFVILDVSTLESTPVLQAQVGDQMLALQRAGLHTALLATSHDASSFEDVAGARLRDGGARIVLVPHGTRPRNIARMTRALRALSRETVVRAAYARGVWGPLVIRLAHPVRHLPFVYDLRGVVTDETIAAATGLPRVKAAAYGALERWCVRAAARVTTVSHVFADEIRRRHGRTDAVVIPPCVQTRDFLSDAARIQATRAECGFAPDDVVLAYSGGIDGFQQLPRLLHLWRDLADEPNIRFLMLTNSAPFAGNADPFAALPEFRERVVRRSVPRSDVPRFLAAADVGFLLRQQRAMNRVASPVKFAEYLAAGIAVVASPDIGDVSSLIVQHRVGAVVDPSDPAAATVAVREFLAALPRRRDAIRARARALALARYDWDAYAGVYRDLYSSLASNTKGRA